MKKLLLISLLILPFFISAQFSVERSVFSSLGYSNSGVINIDATFGEAAIGLFKDGNYQLSVGFHQTVDIINNVNRADDVAISIYPNPTHQMINISSTNEIDKIDLLSLSGSIIYNNNSIQNDESKVDISQLPHGMYILQVTTINGKKIQEQIIVH